jgi:hypothetical protein
LGTLEMAVADARKAAGIKEASVVEYGQPGKRESLISSLIPRINLSALSGLPDVFLQKPGIRTMYLYTP